jgi:hypothetical protein
MINRNFKKDLKKIVKIYFKSEYSNSVDCFNLLVEEFSDKELILSQKYQLKKFMMLFFLGHLVDLPTLNSILDEFEITSTTASNRFKSLYNSSSINNLQNIFERIFETQIQSKLEELNAKDSSSLSRELVTVVLDDSIFK